MAQEGSRPNGEVKDGLFTDLFGEEMTKIPQNRKLLAEVDSLVSKLIPVAKDVETVNILKDIQDLTLKFGGQ